MPVDATVSNAMVILVLVFQMTSCSIRTWISQGIDPALFEKPIEGTIARIFIDRQYVGIPSFGTLPDAKIRLLTDYVITLNRFGEMEAKEIREYSRLTQQRLVPDTLAQLLDL